jgi:hypothetical protein
MPGDLSSWVVGLQGPLPVRLAPDRGPARIHGNHHDAAVGGHLDQPIPEPPGRHAGHHPPEPLAATTATESLPADLASIGKVEVFDAESGAAAPLLNADWYADLPRGRRREVRRELRSNARTGPATLGFHLHLNAAVLLVPLLIFAVVTKVWRALPSARRAATRPTA